MITVNTSHSLGSQYRLYESAGDYCRVLVVAEDIDAGIYCLTAEVTDSSGTPLGSSQYISKISHKLDEVASPVLQSTQGSPTKGELSIVSDELFEGDGTVWISRGPIAADASAPLCELVTIWDREAQELVAKAIRAYDRQSAADEVSALLGL